MYMILSASPVFSCIALHDFSASANLLQGKPWKSAIAGHEISAADEEAERQRLLLERFQEQVSIMHARSR